MAEGGGPGVGAELFAKGIGQQQNNTEDIKPNEDESPQIIVAGAERSIWTASRMAMAVPIIGQMLQFIFPSNPGKVSLFAGMDSEGFAGKPINQGKGPQGGTLYTSIVAPLIKNGSIPGGNPYGDGSSGGGGDGGGTGGGHGFESSIAGLEAPIIAAGGGNHFESIHVPESILGTLSSPVIGDMGLGGRGAGFGMA